MTRRWCCSLLFLMAFACGEQARHKNIDSFELTRKDLASICQKAKACKANDGCDPDEYIQKVDDIVSDFQDSFVDYQVAIRGIAAQNANNYTDWGRYIEEAEELISQKEAFLSPEMILKTKITVAYERCRYADANGDVEYASTCYKHVWEQLPETHRDTVLRTYRYAVSISMAWTYFHMGNYRECFDWLIAGEQYLDTLHAEYQGLHYNQYGLVKQALGSHDEAEACFRKAEQAFARTEKGRDSRHYINNFLDLAQLFLSRANPVAALEALRQASVHAGNSEKNLVFLHNLYAKVYLAIGDINLALWHAKEAQLHAKKYADAPEFWKGMVSLTQAEVLSRKKDWNGATQAVQTALNLLSRDFVGDDWRYNPDPHDSYRKLDLLKTYALKIDILNEWRQSGPVATQPLLEDALDAALCAVKTMKILRSEYNDDEVKAYLSQQSFAIFEHAIEAAAHLYDLTNDARYLDSAFSISESSKALSLLENIRDIEAKDFSQIPDTLIQKENRLKWQMAQLERSLIKKHENHLVDLLSNTRREYRSLLDAFRKDYPEYYQLKHETRTISVAEAQALLTEGETLLAYFFGVRNLYVFSITADNADIRTLPVTEALVADLENFREMVADRRALERQSSLDTFRQVGYRLFETLIKPTPDDTRKLIIIPDGALNIMPFEALLTGARDGSNPAMLPYLLRRYVLASNFSVSVFRRQMSNGARVGPSANKPLLVIAPKAFPEDSRLSLDSARLSETFLGQVRIVRDPSKEQVVQLLNSGYENIFFFTHASAGGREPYLQLYQDTLFLRELYATPIVANLVLLGVCESGVGWNQRGEGVHSLARGFAYQHVPNTVMTLWKVNESASLEIAIDFLYYHFREDFPLAEALRKAQLDFIGENPIASLPYFWAGFVGMVN
jgi:CHAT domain-containing protein